MNHSYFAFRESLFSIRRMFEFLTAREPDTSSAEGRSRQRNRRIVLTALASSAAKFITIATAFITVPLTLNYLGAERYGLWMTISSVIAMMVFADLGVGNGLMNAVAEAYGRDDGKAIRTHLANAIVVLAIIAAVILVLFFTVYSFVPWGSFFNVTSLLAAGEAGPALAVFIVCFALGIPLGMVQYVQMGLQEGFVSSLWQGAGSIAGLILTIAAIRFECGLPWLVLALAGAPLIVLVLNGVTFFFLRRRDLMPRLSSVSLPGMKRILYGGSLFFSLQLTVSIAYFSDNLFIANLIHVEAVAQYAVVSRLFEGVVMMIGIMFAPLWPAYGEARARGDRSWIRNALIRSMTATLAGASAAAALLVTFHEPIFAFWVGPKHAFPFNLVFFYAIWMLLKGLGTTYSMFLNGMNILKFQLLLSVLFMGAALILKYQFTIMFGSIGIVYALIISYVVITMIPCALYTKSFLRY
jgi:O-antigen/teichoic acid export membrane protein